ncbi:hypothetical protein TNCT_422971 [Trichonephila clavata]|uniref:Secreted protein n=1 Tax=Trichonephila clavata TaxID=2740835 RepID=A0A8X6H384_TRICU|nr:hypothetical protein TNCT_422971 [Trichonephila clavata]
MFNLRAVHVIALIFTTCFKLQPQQNGIFSFSTCHMFIHFASVLLPQLKADGGNEEHTTAGFRIDFIERVSVSFGPIEPFYPSKTKAPSE